MSKTEIRRKALQSKEFQRSRGRYNLQFVSASINPQPGKLALCVNQQVVFPWRRKAEGGLTGARGSKQVSTRGSGNIYEKTTDVSTSTYIAFLRAATWRCSVICDDRLLAIVAAHMIDRFVGGLRLEETQVNTSIRSVAGCVRALVVTAIMCSTGIAGDEPLPGATQAKSGPPLRAQTKARVDALRRSGKGLLEFATAFSDMAGAWQLQKRIEELKPAIEAKMPANGGVLVVAYIDEFRVGEGVMRTLRSVVIEGGYSSEEEARKDFARSKVTVARTAKDAAAFTPSPFVSTSPRFFWFAAAAVSVPSLKFPSSAEHEESRKKLQRLLASLKQINSEEQAKAEIAWKAIQAENKRLNDKRVANNTEPREPDEVAARGELDLQNWEKAERASFASERAAIEALREASRLALASVAAMSKEVCPQGLPYEQCKVHEAWKNDYLQRRAAHLKHSSDSEGQALRRSEFLEKQESQIELRKAARKAELDAKVSEAKNSKESLDSQKQTEAEFASTLAEFDELDKTIQSTTELIQQIEAMLSKFKD